MNNDLSAKNQPYLDSPAAGRWSIPARHFRWVTATGFLLATGLLISVIGMAYRETRQQIASSDSVIRSRDVLAAIAEFTSATRTATKNVTDYYTNGIESEVEAFSSSEKNIHAVSARLQSLTLDNPSQHQSAVNLNSQMDQALVWLHQVIELHRQGVKGTEGLAGINTGIRPVSQQLNKSIADITTHESELLKSRSNMQAIASRGALRLELWEE